MSQHRFNLPDGRGVVCGWDRPLQHFFLDIEDEYTSLEEPDGGLPTAEAVVERLTEYNVPRPDELEDNLRRDQERDEGNLVLEY